MKIFLGWAEGKKGFTCIDPNKNKKKSVTQFAST